MKHLGDITKLSGYTLPPVDIITGGSPCQDLSVAGKRAGLAGERSGLFMEQIRIIKEMRENDKTNGRADDDIRPRFMVWENVPGAFSSNKGEDFRAVLEETAKIADSNAVIPRPSKGKWQPAGCILGDGWSIAWRVHDAQFWGVPQRRKRIALVADFRGGGAPEILFERKGVPGDIETSAEQEQRTTTDVEASVGKTSRIYDVRISSDGTKNWRAHCYETDICRSLDTGGTDPDSNHGGVAVVQGFPLGFRAENTRTYDEKATTVCNGTRPGFTCGVIQGFDAYNQAMTGDVAKPLTNKATDSDHIPIVYHKKGHPQNAEQGQGWEQTETNDTLNAFDNGESRTPTVVVDMGGGKSQCGVTEDVTPTLATTHGGEPVVLENHPQDSRVKLREDGIFQTLDARMGMGGGNVPMVMEDNPTYVFGRQHDVTSDDKSPFLCAKMGTGGNNMPMIMETYQKTTGSLMASGYNKLGTQEAMNDMFIVNNYANEAYDKWSESEKSASLRASGGVYGGGSESLSVGYVVRRLTPLECERLQGFPDHWTDIGEWTDSKGKKHKDADSPRYKALGNSIALPFWEWMAERMIKQLNKEKPTMASLFDGIGGFPLVFSRHGCEPVWASEIEEFPMAVTERRFNGE